MGRPRLAGVAAILATGGLGAALLAALGAPPRLVLMNLGATVAAAALLPILVPVARLAWRWPGVTLAAAAAALWTTTLWGEDLEGVRRWARAGPLLFHVGFLVLPPALAALLSAPRSVGVAGLCAIAAALALQPDGGAAMAFAAGVAVLAVRRRAPTSAAWLAVAGAGAAVAWFRPDPLPAVAFVEGVVRLALDRSPALGVLAVVALALPAGFVLVADRRDAALAAFWAGAAAACLIGNFPTPIIGAGVTPILAYALTWALLAARPDAAARTRRFAPGSPASGASAP